MKKEFRNFIHKFGFNNIKKILSILLFHISIQKLPFFKNTYVYI